jgi:putative tricarboxylic transport membrane protein
MKGLIRAPVDLLTGALLLALGGGALWVGRDWRAGTLAEMDTAYFPRILASALVLGAGVLIVRAFLRDGEPLPAAALRPLAAVTAAVVAFGAAIEHLGLAAAILLVVALASLAGLSLRLVPLVLLWVVLTAACGAIFVWGVALPVRMWPA